EGGPAFLDMVDVPKPRGEPRYESLQAPLALEERPITEVLAVDFEQVEGAEIRPVAATKQEPVEVAAAIRLEARDLAVQDRPHRFHAVRDLLTEHVPLREDVATPRHQPALVPIDPGHGSRRSSVRTASHDDRTAQGCGRAASADGASDQFVTDARRQQS